MRLKFGSPRRRLRAVVSVSLEGARRGGLPLPDSEATGYYQNIGFSALDLEDSKALLAGFVSDGSINWADTLFYELTLDEAQQLLVGRSPLDDKAFDGKRTGVWFVGGHLYY